jgi:osmoprotectant transport system permease protein
VATVWETLRSAAAYLSSHPDRFLSAVQAHVVLSLTSLAVGLVFCLPLGILAARSSRAAFWAINAVSVVRVVPSLGILILMLPLLGLGFLPALVALSALAFPPILLNTYVGYRDVDAAVREAARGMGMTSRQVFWWIETPLALPVVAAGVRTASVEVVASATLAAFIGAGGLGEFIVNGLGMNDTRLLLVGAVPVAILAILTESAFGLVERLAAAAAW